MAECTYEVILLDKRHYKCHREIHSGQHCIFHLEDANKNMAELGAAIIAELKDTSSQTLGLTGTVFNSLSAMFDNLTISKTVHLEKAIFDRTLFFRNVTFEKPLYMNEARFTKGVEFDNVEFLDDFYFDHAKADSGRECIFTGTKFRKGASFHYARFESFVRICCKTEASGDTVLEETRFAECVNFRNTYFQAAVLFKGRLATFENGADFESCHFGSGCGFHSVDFLDGTLAILPEGAPNSITFDDCRIASATSFNDNLIGSTVVFRDCNVKGVRLLPILASVQKHPENVVTQRCSWPRTGLRPGRFWSPLLYSPRGRYCAADEFDDWKSQELLHLYSSLHSRFYNEKLYDLSNAFYDGFMVTKRKVSEGSRTAKFIDGFYSVFSRYGNSIRRPAVALLGMWLIVPLLLLLFGLKLELDGKELTIAQLDNLWQYVEAFIINISLSTLMRSDALRPPSGSVQNAILLLETVLNGFFLGFLALGIRRHFAPKKPV